MDEPGTEWQGTGNYSPQRINFNLSDIQFEQNMTDIDILRCIS